MLVCVDFYKFLMNTHLPCLCLNSSAGFHDRQHSSSSSSLSSLSPHPPQHLELTKQFVEGDSYCLAIQWQPPTQLSGDITGYNVYVNGSLVTTVDDVDTTSALLTGIQRNKVNEICPYMYCVCNRYTMPTRDLSRIHEAIINNPEGVARGFIDYC